MAISVKQSAKVAAWALVAVAVAAAPVGVSAVTADTVINATVNKGITLSSTSPVAFSITPTTAGAVSSASDTVTVSTNSTLGYTLTLMNQDATTSLQSGGNNIAAHTAGTQTTPTALANNTWGYRVVGVGGFTAGAYTGETDAAGSTSTWAGVPANGSANTLKNTSSAASGDVTTVWYGVRVNLSQPNGLYTDTVRYTATAN